MAELKFTHACGHRGRLSEKVHSRRVLMWRARSLEEKVCPRCEGAKKTVESIHEEQGNAALESTSRGLPPLTGRSKRAPLATAIRLAVLADLAALEDEIRARAGWPSVTGAEADEALEAVFAARGVALSHQDAEWWIEFAAERGARGLVARHAKRSRVGWLRYLLGLPASP